jgi:hypothetical protein
VIFRVVILCSLIGGGTFLCLHLQGSTLWNFIHLQKYILNNAMKTSMSNAANYYCDNIGMTTDGVWIGEWIYWPLIHTTQNYKHYSAVANLHNSQITTAPAKHFPACCAFTSHSLAVASNSGDCLASHAQILPSQPPVQKCTQSVNWQLSTNWVAPVVFLITTLYGPSRKKLFPRVTLLCLYPLLFTDPFPTNRLYNTVVYLPIA